MAVTFASCGGLKQSVSSISFIRDVDLPHGIRNISESVSDWNVSFGGLFVGDAYEFEVEFDNAAVETYSFTPTAETHIYTDAYPSGATKIVRVEFLVVPLPISITNQNYKGFAARTDSTEFYDILESLAP